MALAGFEFMFEEARKYVLEREAFGKTIAQLQESCALPFLKLLYQYPGVRSR